MNTFADFRISIPNGATQECDTTCPECSAQRKKKTARCLSVNVALGTWHCHHCGWSGGLRQGTRNEKPAWNKPQFRRPAPIAENREPTMLEWFQERGIPQAVLERNRISTARVYMPQVEDHVQAIAFPYFRADELLNVKYRDLDKNFRMETGAERVLYGLNDIAPERCVIVEGEIDKLSIEVAGITSCVSVPDGAPSENTKNYSSKFTFLDADAPALESVQEWILAVDNDAPGNRLGGELARRLGREKCKTVVWPGDCKDANDVLRSFGPEVLRECIELAKALPIEGVFSVLDLSEKIQQLYEYGWERGVETGWAEVDRYYTVRPGELTVVTGMPNSGKSNWVDALLVNLAAQFGWRFALFSPENQPLEDHMARMIEKYAGQPFADGPIPRMDQQTKDAAERWLNDHMFWILPQDDAEWNIDTVLERAKSLVLRKGITGLLIDPWNELEHLLPPGMSETVYIGQVLKRIRQFARRHSVHVWVVAHPQKIYRENGTYPVPTLYDISGSANWRNKADNGIIVWRDFGTPSAPVEIHVQKIRFRQIGRIGLAKLKYHAATQTYSEYGFEDPTNETRSRARGGAVSRSSSTHRQKAIALDDGRLPIGMLHERIRRLLKACPDDTDAEIARVAKVSIEEVQQVRKAKLP
jgi:twinkle protein